MSALARVDKLWFRERLREKEWTQQKLAEWLELDKAAVTRMLNGERQVGLAEASKIAKGLGLDLRETIEHLGVGLPPKRETVPLLGHVDAGGVALLDGVGTRVYSGALPGADAALRVLGGALDGWNLLYTPRSGLNAGDIGSLGVVTVAGGMVFVGVLSQSATLETGHYLLEKLDGRVLRVLAVTVSPVVGMLPSG